MKLNATLIGLIASQAVFTSADSSPNTSPSSLAALEAECGALGVMNWDLEDLPPNTDRSQLRKCRDHPNSLESRGALHKRWCVNHDSGGCSNSGYCWRACKKDNNSPWYKWCWLAWTDGRGDWIKCKSDRDCEQKNIGRGACAVGNCDACGCNCSDK